MRRILFTETNFSALPNPPAGFKYIGFNGPDFTIKQEDGQITESVGATGPQGPTGPAGSGGTGSSDRLISSNVTYNLESILDENGTLNTPLLLPLSFTAVCDESHYDGSPSFSDTNWWEFEVHFVVSQDGVVETQIDNIFPILTNPGYVSGDTFIFTETDHGIPGFNFEIVLMNVVLPGGAGWTANLGGTQPPDYPSTIKSLGAIKLTADTNSFVLGTDGSIDLPRLTVNLHNGGDQTAQTLKFADANTQAVITTATPSENNSAQRLIIQGARATGTGEGGDVYFWGGDADVDGGDIKIYAGDADSNSEGYGGYVNIAGGDAHTIAGHVNIDGGSSELQAGDINIRGGYSNTGDHGEVIIQTAGSINFEFLKDGKFSIPGTIKSNNIITLDAGDSVSILTNTTTSTQSFTFDENGQFTLPNGASIIESNFTAADGQNAVLSQYDGNTQIYTMDNGFGIQTYNGGSYSTWLFDSLGDLTLPQGGDIKDIVGNSVLAGVSVTSVTYSTISNLVNNGNLIPGRFYEITDFKTCYDQPDYDIYGNPITSGNYKEGSTHSIIVFSTGTSSLSVDAWQPDFPKDKIKYDVSWTQSEHTGGTAYGRITERIDEWNNRTDYDHREVYFKRYDYYLYDINNPQVGTISSVVNGVVTGVDTLFTNFSVGDVIALPNFSEEVFKIDTIMSATAMSLTGSVWDVTSFGEMKYYSVNYIMNMCSPKKSNVSDEFWNIRTFDNVTAFNNYIGDQANSYIMDGIGDFILSNNVFLDGPYYNNRFGNNCFNNTFDDDCTNNTIGNFFCDNITDDDFDQNQIGNYFQRNIITANFQRNSVGEDFNDNIITVGSFYRNRINNQFENNKISGNDFQNNIIGNAFANNTINTLNDGFLKNIIGVGFNNNEIRGEFDSNTFGNGSNANKFYSNMYENKIGDYFNNNIIGLSTNYGGFSFYENHIGNDFYSNNIYRDFYQNRIFNYFVSNHVYNHFYRNEIGYNFNDNIVGDFENYGANDFVQNTCKSNIKGNLFFGYTKGNEFGENFTDNILGNNIHRNIFGYEAVVNTIGNNFEKNIISSYFSYNNIGNDFFSNTIGNSFYSNTIANNFAYNKIGENFNNNNIQNDFGYGGAQSYGNIIGNYFENNTVGEYFYSNIISDLFGTNVISDYFQFNDVKVHYLHNTDFREHIGNILSFSYSASNGTNGLYNNIFPTGGSGNNAEFSVIVTGGFVTNVTLINAGASYSVSDVLTINGGIVGGTNGLDNITITINTISSTPSVYEPYQCTIFKNSSANNRLSYYDDDDVLTIKGITE